MRDLVSLGELLVDFTPVGESAAGNPVFERNPGGGPANLACAAAHLAGGGGRLRAGFEGDSRRQPGGWRPPEAVR